MKVLMICACKLALFVVINFCMLRNIQRRGAFFILITDMGTKSFDTYFYCCVYLALSIDHIYCAFNVICIFFSILQISDKYSGQYFVLIVKLLLCY